MDVIVDGNNNLTLTSGPTSCSTAGSNATTLQATGVLTYTATHYITAAAYTSSVKNRVTVTASSPGQSNNVTDISDDGDDTDGNTTDDSTDVEIDPVPLIEVKNCFLSRMMVWYHRDRRCYNYVITIENKGNVTLSSLTVTDSLTDASGGSLAMGNGPYFSGANQI